MKKLAVFALVGAMFLTGCGTTVADEIAKQQADGTVKEQETEQQTEQKEKVTETEEVTETEKKVSEEELLAAKRRSRFADVVSRLYFTGTWPDETTVDLSGDATFGSLDENQFAICDVDGDGEEELVISYSITSMAGMQERVYGYDANTDSVYQELLEFPAMTFYSNGVVEVALSHNHSMGMDFYPFNIYQYNEDTREYELVGSVDAWEKSYFPEDYEGNAFPDDEDTDGDGVLYYVHEGDEYSYDKGMDKEDYEAWHQDMVGDAEVVNVNWSDFSIDNATTYAKNYIRVLCEKQMDENLVYGKDLGLQMMMENMSLGDMESLLSEKYGVTFEESADYEGEHLGSYDGQQVFDLYYEDGGSLAYENAQIQGLTIMGIYPGMAEAQAKEQLESAGMMLGWSQDNGSCYYTGIGMGNYAVYIEVTDGVISKVSISVYCAYVG